MSSPLIDATGKAYRLGEESFPRVTGIINCAGKPALVPSAVKSTVLHIEELVVAGAEWEDIDWIDAKREYKRQWDRKRDDGTAVHLAIETVVRDGEIDVETLTPTQERILEQYFRWYRAYQPEYIASEVAVFSRTHGYAGTVDFMARIGGLTILGDFKTGAAVWPEVALQLAAYANADFMVVDGQEQPLPTFDEWCVVHLRPDQWQMPRIRPEMRELAWQRFRALREFAYWHTVEGVRAEQVMDAGPLPSVLGEVA